ncbi:MAG: hypothetical protein ABI581_04045, partial [Sediminibacterium sp.]
NQQSYWSLVKQLDKKLPPKFPVYLFTDNRLSRFMGSRPEVSIDTRWNTFTNKDSTATFISKAYMSFDDSVMVIMGETNPSATVYTQQAIAVNKPKQKDLLLDVIDGSLSIRYKDQSPVLIDTATWCITIYADTYLNDARYVQSALQSIQQVSKRKVKIALATRIADVPGKQDWLFWLSDQPIPQSVDAVNILLYEKGETVLTHSWLRDDNTGNL